MPFGCSRLVMRLQPSNECPLSVIRYGNAMSALLPLSTRERPKIGQGAKKLWHNNHTQVEMHDRRRVWPHLVTVPPLLQFDFGLGWGHKLGMQHVFHQLCQEFVRRH